MSAEERTRAVQARWSSRDPRGVFPVIPCLCCVIERETETRVYREVHDAATETMCSPGQHNEALSRTTWFECTSDEKRGGKMCSPICNYSPHHISTAMNEALTQTAPTAVRQSEPKPFTTCPLHNAVKNSFLGLHQVRTLGEDTVCLQAARA